MGLISQPNIYIALTQVITLNFRRQASSTNPALAALARNPELMENIPQTATLFNRMYKRTTTAPATSSNGTKLPGTKGHKKKVGL